MTLAVLWALCALGLVVLVVLADWAPISARAVWLIAAGLLASWAYVDWRDARR